MSAEAVNHVIAHFPRGGAQFITMIAVASMSKDRREPFHCKATYREIADVCRCSKRQAFDNCAKLQTIGHLNTTPGQGRGVKTTFKLLVRFPKPQKKRKPTNKKPTNIVSFRAQKG